MLNSIAVLLAAFTAPEDIKMNPQSMLWMLPLAAAVAIVYKATKLHKITARLFLKETALLFTSIVVFIIAAAAVLWFVTWLAIE
jgi:hypothetical protein